MCKNPLVSIIIPCYNYDKYIEQCIQSALDQTYGNIEVIVVDNGSTDDSLKKINTFLHDTRVLVIEFKNNIPPGSVNKSAVGVAIELSKGEYISLLYADDWYIKDKIEKQVKLFNKLPSSVGLVYCHGYKYSEKDKIKSKLKYQSVRGYVFKSYLINGDVVIPISPLVKRYCYDIIGVGNPYTGSEYDFLAMSQYINFDFVDEYLVVMREHELNDAKNINSVYRRVKHFHSKKLLTNSVKSRVGRLANLRMARDYLSFGLAFITMMDMTNGKKAIFDAVKIYPLYIINPRVLVSIILLFIPASMSKYFLSKLGKLSIKPQQFGVKNYE